MRAMSVAMARIARRSMNGWIRSEAQKRGFPLGRFCVGSGLGIPGVCACVSRGVEVHLLLPCRTYRFITMPIAALRSAAK